MNSNKIHEWHLDNALRAKINGGTSGSSVDMESVLSDYVKKTDTIQRSQLSDSVFDVTNQTIANLRNSLNGYRANNVPIVKTDLSSELQLELENLGTVAGSLPSDFNEQVEDIVIDIVGTTEFKNSIVNQVASNVSDLQVDVETLQTNVGTLQTNVGTLQTNIGTLQTNVGTLQTNLGTASSDILELQAANTTINSDIFDLQGSVESLQSQYNTLSTALSDHITTSANTFRANTDAIGMLDLTQELQSKISNYDTDIASLEMKTSTLEDNYSFSDKSIMLINVATTSSELNTMKTALVSPILYTPKMMLCKLENGKWNCQARFFVNEESNDPYANHILSNSNIDTGSLTPTISSGNITVNNNTNDFESLIFGIYSTSLCIKILVQHGNNISIPLTILIDGQFFSFDLPQDLTEDTFSEIYFEVLSPGAHRIEILILPNSSLTMSSTVGLFDDEHTGLLVSADIPAESTYNNTKIDNVDYFNLSNMTGTYSFTEVDDFDTIDSSSYEWEIFDTKKVEGRIIYSEYDDKVYAINNRKVILLRS